MERAKNTDHRTRRHLEHDRRTAHRQTEESHDGVTHRQSAQRPRRTHCDEITLATTKHGNKRNHSTRDVHITKLAEGLDDTEEEDDVNALDDDYYDETWDVDYDDEEQDS